MPGLALVLLGLALALAVLLWQIERHRSTIVRCEHCTAELLVPPRTYAWLRHYPDGSHELRSRRQLSPVELDQLRDQLLTEDGEDDTHA